MILRSALTTTVPNTLIAGIATVGERTAITAALRLANGDVEGDVIETVGDGLWATLDQALNELRMIRAKHIVMMTTSADLYDFLHAPVYVQQQETKKVWVGRDQFTVKVGGNEHQWSILRHLFVYVWRCERVERLQKAEGLLR